ncbi:hypothetical protein D049_1087 [Vibrio parahaemolyticus VPTS-2010]|nr:hypothetical protein D049_1087 [Vibrio parahaemolyticus VPTS-2010]
MITVVKPWLITVSFGDRAAQIIGNQELRYAAEVLERISVRF